MQTYAKELEMRISQEILNKTVEEKVEIGNQIAEIANANTVQYVGAKCWSKNGQVRVYFSGKNCRG